MGFDLDRITLTTRATAVDFAGGHVLHLTYAPGQITPIAQARAKAAAEADDPLVLAQVLAAIVVDWDVTRSGTPVPPTVDAMADFPIEILGRILGAIGEDAQLGKATAATSDAGSRPTGT
jgi:hypothetical protein